MRVLVVDDSPENRYLMEVTLRARGYEVLCAANGAEALQRLKAGPVDLILSDILMPKMDGYALCRACKQDDALKDIPFIFATAAYTDERDEAFALTLGADGFMRRPAEPETMMAVVDEVLEKRHASRARPAPPAVEEPRYLAEHSERLASQLERKVAELEKEIARRLSLERALRTVTRGNQALVHAADERELLAEMCQIIVDVGGFRQAWAGFTESGTQGIVHGVVRYGAKEGRPQGAATDSTDSATSLTLAGLAVATGTPQVIQDVARDERAAPWRQEALQLGYASCIALPLTSESGSFGALVIYAAQADAFDDEEVNLLSELSGDLAYGITALRTRIQRDRAMAKQQRYLAQLRTKLEETIQAIAAVVEARDPYTAGHEKRVAELAAAIAGEMGLPEDRIDGLRVAGSIHDVGKIRVPTEILTRPGKLTDREFDLVRLHSQVGYDVLRGIDFPWPIATMVLQHHERLDGSGYPSGLKNSAIILEAQILAVADSVEAMATHRPYRPALGLPAALDDLAKHRGTLYRADVVDACLNLFREGKYQLSS